jgi:hypothetical protein
MPSRKVEAIMKRHKAAVGVSDDDDDSTLSWAEAEGYAKCMDIEEQRWISTAIAWLKSSQTKPARSAQRSRHIEWITVADLDDCGHGVEFWHHATDDAVIAFLKGYGWQQGSASVRVLLRSDPPEWAPATLIRRWNTTLREVKSAVRRFLAQPDGSRRQFGPVKAWFNG